MILKAKHHSLVYPFFKIYALRKIKKHFHDCTVIGNFEDKKTPLLVVANHLSWWDGFWIMQLNLKLLKRKFHFMMLEEQLRKYWFFTFTGGFSINKKGKSMLETIDYTAQLLNDSGNMVLLFPQGEIQSMHQQEISFEKGIEHIIRKTNKPIQVLFVVHLCDYFSNKKPSLFQYISSYAYSNFSFTEFQHSYRQFYTQCINEQIRRNKA